MIILSGLFILGIGIVGGYQLATLPKLIDYILSLEDTEYRIKFSKNTPLKVVFTEILEPM